jgi:hypothetical protein
MASQQDLEQLTAMGFPNDSAREALAIANGNMETAVNYLLGIEPPSTLAPAAVVAAPAEQPPVINSLEIQAGGIITCPISQYSVENGRSACTCIALTGATQFLKKPLINSEFLQLMIGNGVENYKSLSSAFNVEHLSAEEVLQKDQGTLFPLKTIGFGVHQGILSNDSDHPMGLRLLIQGIQEEEESNDWIVVLITKTPETVLVCLQSGSVSTSSYWLIDSHPRSHLGVESAYAKHHPSLSSLVLSLQTIFPYTDLGSDIPEMMAIMYNSFDMYPLKIGK